MDLDSPSPPSSPASLQNSTTKIASISPAQRITELNHIDTSISLLLRSASTATLILANEAHPHPNSNSTNLNTNASTTLSSAKSSFTAAAQTYFSTLSSIEVRLRRQVYALEEAGLIAAGDERDARRGRTLNTDDGVRGRGAGGGALDPSWLNARVGEEVEVQKKREVLAEARELVEKGRVWESGGMDVDVEYSGRGEEGRG